MLAPQFGHMCLSSTSFDKHDRDEDIAPLTRSEWDLAKALFRSRWPHLDHANGRRYCLNRTILAAMMLGRHAGRPVEVGHPRWTKRHLYQEAIDQMWSVSIE